LYLVGCGVPYDVAFNLDTTERLAHVVIFGELSGLTYDWKRMRWEQP
jgi:hypothetical protein